MDLEVDQRDSGTESKLATRQWTSDMFFRLVLAMLVPPAPALLGRVAVGDMGRFFFGMTTARKRAGCMEIKPRPASGHPDPGLSFVLYMRACLLAFKYRTDFEHPPRHRRPG